MASVQDQRSLRGTERFLYLDGWRGIAIILVLLAHFGQIGVMDAGRFGVDLFFVLSGLLMSRILFERRLVIGVFYRRRISRIFPAFFAFLLAVIILSEADGHRAKWQELITFATFTRTYYLHPKIWYSVLPAGNLWSLNVEEHCYLLLALIAAISAWRKRAGPILFALAAFTLVAIRVHMKVAYDPEGSYLLNTECAATGLLLSAAYRTFAHRWRVLPWTPLAALVLAGACYLHGMPWYSKLIGPPVLLTFSVNHIQESWSWVVRTLEVSWLRQIGIWSYSIYLWQQPFYVNRTIFPLHSAILFALGTGCLSYYLLENPARRWLNAHWSGRKSQEYQHFPPAPALSEAEGRFGETVPSGPV